jgi:hypothetical protein
MNVSLSKKLLVAALVVATGGALITLVPASVGQEAKKADKTAKTDKAETTEKKAKGRLPQYYADIVTSEQREKIYSIQAKHQEKISELNATLLAATRAMNAEIEAVLTADQKIKLKAAQEEGAAKKKKAGAEKKAAEDAKKAPAEETKKTETKAATKTK